MACRADPLEWPLESISESQLDRNSPRERMASAARASRAKDASRASADSGTRRCPSNAL